MDTETKYKSALWILIVMTVMNVTFLATIGFNNYKSNRITDEVTATSVKTETDVIEFSGRYFRDQLALTPEQMDKFRVFNPIFRQRAKQIAVDLSLKREEMMQEMVSTTSDTILLKNLSFEIGALHSQLKIITFRYYSDIKKITNNEQQQKLADLFSKMFLNDLPVEHQGNGEPQRWRRGRGFNQ